MSKNKYKKKDAFENVDDLVNYIYKSHTPTEIQLQNGLYYLYAYYAIVFPNRRGKGSDIPIRLFNPDFRAYPHGALITHVRDKYQNNAYNKNKTINITDIQQEILDFVDEYMGTVTLKTDLDIVYEITADPPWLIGYSHSKYKIDKDWITHSYESRAGLK